MWTKPEINAYTSKARAYKPLQQAYQEVGLEHPQERAQFLAEEVLQLTMTDHDVVMRITHDEGRAAGLLVLEDMVIAAHKNTIKEHRNNIKVPL